MFLAPTVAALEITAQQYGNIISIFGATAIVMYFLGGWFADRFSPKVLIAVGLAGVGVLDLYIAQAPGYVGTLVAHVLMAVLGMGLYWPALIKAISLLGDSTEQGRLFGFLEGTRGVTSTIVGLIGAGLVAVAVTDALGVLWLIRIYGILSFVFAALVLFSVSVGSRRPSDGESSAVSIRQLWLAARNKYTLLIGITAMLMYTFYTLLGYFSPLLETHFGVAAGLIGVIGVMRTYFFQLAAPVGGLVVDKVTRSSPRFLRWMFAGCLAVSVAFLVLPRSMSFAWLAVVLMFVLSLFVFASRGVYFATVGEVRIPVNERGGVIGLVSGIAFIPDAFLPSVAAWWIGDPNASPPVAEAGGGYTTMFAVLIGASLLGRVF
ncbi:MFS transporter [Spiractinospora alimapuensis]|uniref:MFS transporter n=1 Tax=Spiractinospora alimapuensis TaxID=2820884 RepID=UPI001F3F0353|nr:MFS transporter [Spiractinospora alimapuensis]